MRLTLIEAADQLDRGWVWLYTAGMSPEHAQQRREEMDSDQWELTDYSRRRGWSTWQTAGHKLARWLLGIPADITWRLELGAKGIHRDGLVDLAAALLIVAGLALSLPGALLFTLQGQAIEQGYNMPFFTYSFLVVSLLCVGGFVLQELRPRAGTVLMLLGVASLSLALWWTLTIPLLGLGATTGVIYRASRLKC